MVANQTQQTVSTQNYELTQSHRDAKNAMVDLKVRDGKVLNLELWRKKLDVALGMMNANFYLNKFNNIYLTDENDIKKAKAEVHTLHTTTHLIKQEKGEVIVKKEIVKIEKKDNDKLGIKALRAKERVVRVAVDQINKLDHTEITKMKENLEKSKVNDILLTPRMKTAVINKFNKIDDPEKPEEEIIWYFRKKDISEDDESEEEEERK